MKKRRRHANESLKFEAGLRSLCEEARAILFDPERYALFERTGLCSDVLRRFERRT